MSTNTENNLNAPEEYYLGTAGQNPSQFRTILTSGLITNADNTRNIILYNANDLTALQNQILTHPTVPAGLSFDKNPESNGDPIFSGVSNAYQTRVNGITDFTAYNNYIHYDIAQRKTPLTHNVFQSIRKASFRFQKYSSQYR
jgi:hypothetical protein